ncbi:MAG: bifunctional phosphopantothenoylcysteine decarboxylase/phosphopantothenate--cysteine ligase CoaBC [Clostridiales bacterium]|nr:bifunctional phosphopantothenoylcysteine decarboxylase/phosphopantothenate--cysteine ligase CoaBC [Clostridiales bacterium]
MNSLKGKTVLIGVTGGIAAYKTCSVVSALVKLGATCHVMMTKNATKFVAPLSFETLSRNRVTVDTFDRDFTWEVEHVSLAKKADAVLIAPATANVIAKLAAGICDDFLTTTVLACTCPIIIAPAMNTAMLENPVTWLNIDTLVSRGMMAVFGGEGRLACGDTGAGRMAEPDALIEELNKLFSKKSDLAGKTVLVTSGATRTPIDPVRFLTNRSSGKMGYNVALAAHERGAKVIYVKGITDDFVIPPEWSVYSVTTTAELMGAVKDNYELADIIVAAAAPCDYEVELSPEKIKADTTTLTLTKAADVAAFVGKNKGNRKLVVFAAETNDCEKNALDKLKKKNADLVVLNDVTKEGAGFDTDTNIATLITKKSVEPLSIMSKRDLADKILDKTLEL